MTTTKILRVATKSLTIMAHNAMWQGTMLSRHMRCFAKYPVVGAEASSP